MEKVVASLTPALLSGTGFALSKVRDKVNEIIHPNQIHNYQLKSFLIQNLDVGIKFCPSTRKNDFFFSADLSADDIAQKIWPTDVIKDAAHTLRKEIKSYTFGLEKKHCDAFDLQTKWNAETFLAALFDLNRIPINVDDLNKKEVYLDGMIHDSDDDSDDTDDEATETPSCRTITKSICAYPIYKIMVYTVTD